MNANGEKDFPTYVGIALGIITQDWSRLGLGEDPSVAASDDLDVTVDRIAALLLIRIVAWIQPRATFSDLSTITLSRKILLQPESWPESVTPEVMEQLKDYVKTILSDYKPVPYHNFQHCYHVTISTNKLLDMIVQPMPDESRVCTYGFRDDPLMQFALVFSALIHDVEHLGIPNRQLANEDNDLAIQYNDTSIAEHRSTFLGFSELLKPKYAKLRSVVFPETQDYRRFRAAVVNLVLTTDIASPERSQIAKSKWKEAFGDPYETVERKVRRHMERRASMASSRPGSRPIKASRRMSTQSIMSELTLDPSQLDALEDDLEDDESVSVTPDTSEDEFENLKSDDVPKFRPPPPKVGAGPPRSKSADIHENYRSPNMRNVRKRGGKDTAKGEKDGASTHSGGSTLSGMALKFHRRLSNMGPSGPSNASAASKRYRNNRLGLLRTVDLSGESLETYSQQKHRPSATGAMTSGSAIIQKQRIEEVDHLRETVVMETIIKAADVAHNLQGWDLMAKYSNRLFLELKRAYVQGRGDDPQEGWFSNQIGFLEAYLLPLARKLDDTGVFGDSRGGVFAQIVEENKERWMHEGMSLTASIIQEGHRRYPEADSDDDIGS